MASEKAEPGRLADGRDLEIQHLIETTGITADQARSLLEKYGNDWARIREEVAKLKG
jgi:hypothetical protein